MTEKKINLLIVILLFSLKIVSSIKLLSKEDSVLIMGKECHASNKYELLIGLEGVSKIKSWTYNSMKVGNFVMPNITNHNRKYVYIDDDYIYLRVNSIDIEEYTGYVYNFECETHTFMCNLESVYIFNNISIISHYP